MAVAAPAPVPTPTVPEALKPLLKRIHEAVPDAHLVGGAVRGLLTGHQPRDLDLVTREDARTAAAIIAETIGGTAFPLDETRGQYRVTLPEGPVTEIDVSQAVDLTADLHRRDFTIDAIASAVGPDGRLAPVIDPTGGLRDLENGIIHMVSSLNLANDPLRLLRAVRLATELRFAVEPDTVAAIRAVAPRIAATAGERQRDELLRIFETPHAAEGLRLADSLALLDVLLPELTPARGVEQPSNHHYYDVFDHSLQAVASLDDMLHEESAVTGRPWLGPAFRELMQGFDFASYLSEHSGGASRLALLKLATLLHDVSKPETKATQPDGRIRFLGHPEKGAVKAEDICRRFRLGNRETRFISLLVEEHLRPTMLAAPGQPPSKRALYRFLRDLGEAVPAVLILSLADAAAATGPRLQQDRWRGHIAYCRYVLYEVSRLDSPEQPHTRLVDGHDLMKELGLEPGPTLGQVLAQVEEAQAVGEIETRDQAIEYARVLVREAK